jgi:hypothetical protein
MLTRRGFAGFASCAICAVTGFIASDASAAEGAPPPVTPGLTRKMLSQMDGPMPGYVTLNMEVEIEAGTVVPGIRILESNRAMFWKAVSNSPYKVSRAAH